MLRRACFPGFVFQRALHVLAVTVSNTTSSQISPTAHLPTTTNQTEVLVTAYDPNLPANSTLSFQPVSWYTPPSPTNIASAQSCWSALTDQELDAVAFFTTSVLGRTWPVETTTVANVVTGPTSTTIYPQDVSTYKLCDGSPRVDAKPITSTFIQTVVRGSYTATVTATPSLSTPASCNDEYGEFCYDWFRYSNLTSSYDKDDTTDSQLLIRECGSPAHYDPKIDNATDWPCLIGGGVVQLYYFPVDTGDSAQDLCNGTRTTISHAITTPAPTIVTDGQTLTSGSVYVSFSSLYAYYDGFAGYHFGTTFKDFWMTLASSDISTQCGALFATDGVGTSLNYADLNYPIPASAYSCAGKCRTLGPSANWPPECATIWDDFNPVMAIPTAVTDLHPAWKTCAFYDEDMIAWLYDPPIALTQASQANLATYPGQADPTSTPAPSPGSYSASSAKFAENTGGPSQPQSSVRPNNSPANPDSIAYGPSASSDTPASSLPISGQVAGNDPPGRTDVDSSGTAASSSATGVDSITPSPTAEIWRAGSFSITATPVSGSSGVFVADDQTLASGAVLTFANGGIVSNGPSGLVALDSLGSSGVTPLSIATNRPSGPVAVETSTSGGATPLRIATNGPAPGTPAVSRESLQIVATPVSGQPGVFVVDGITLSPGGNAVQVSGMTVSAASGTLVNVAPSTTQPLSILTNGADAEVGNTHTDSEKKSAAETRYGGDAGLRAVWCYAGGILAFFCIVMAA